MINTKLQSIIDTKSAIGNAIVNKGGTITSETPFFNYAAQIDGISTGTPQTIFAASDGSKWALTNVVNLTNVSNNVTYDFNRWQPANNSTSDPILNVGTVNGNISGNIRIVQVNQVNIAQYSNIVINDTDGAKYVGYNGYDSQTNPTPTGNTTFNRWLLNNSASGTVIFANTTITNGGTFNGPNSSVNEASMPFVNNSNQYGYTPFTIAIKDGFIYVAGAGAADSSAGRDVKKYHESNLVFVGNTPNYGATISNIVVNNGFIYAGGGAAATSFLVKYYVSNLTIVGNTANYGAALQALTTNNGFIYIGGQTPAIVKKYYESNLGFVSNSIDYQATIRSLATNNGFIYVGGSVLANVNRGVSKFYESNLALLGNTPNYTSGGIYAMGINNGSIYVGGYGQSFGNGIITKYDESNLSFISNSTTYNGLIRQLKINNGFIYLAGENLTLSSNSSIEKFYESNLNYLTKTNNYGGAIQSIAINNGFIYAVGTTNETIKQFQERGESIEQLTFYTATKIKE